MARITIRFYAWIREELGIEKLNMTANTLENLLENLRQILGDKANVLTKERVLISINNVIIKSKNQKLNDGDIVDIMPLGSGG